MVKLTYTKQMQENDKLWETEQEDIELMKRLYREIIDEATKKGFKGIVEIYEGTGEACIDLYTDEEHKRLCDLGEEEPFGSYGFCKPLIKDLESIINY